MAIKTLSYEYNLADASVKLFGIDLYGVKEITFDDSGPENEFHYGNSPEAVSFGTKGKTELTGEITLLNSQYLTLKAALLGKPLSSAAPSTMIVNLSSFSTTNVVNFVFEGLLFQKAKVGFKEGSSANDVKIPFIFRKLNFNAS